MSRYLSDRIAACPNVAVLYETEVVQLLGTPGDGLQRVRWRHRRTGDEEEQAIPHLFVFTGADPATCWLASCGVRLDLKGFIETGTSASLPGRVPLPLETNVEGVFAIGDVRSGSVKRVGAAIGEGASVVVQLHSFLTRRASARR
jgi:thioredoxin reductase (NADPH)